ncbi:MAG: MarR family transcriptional regulator [Myxococcota bacterium]
MAKRSELPEGALRLDRQLCFALYAATRAMTQAYHPALDALGLTYPQYLVLLVLWEEDDLMVKELGAQLMLDSGTLTPLLKRLEAAGIVSRRRDPDDERRLRVTLTAHGRRLRAKAPSVYRCVAERLADQSPRELAKLREQLVALTQTLKGDPS